MASRQLWAPWRIEYIRGPKARGCIFCDLPARGPRHFRENLILAATDDAFVMLNRYPFASGHLMVVPRAHTSELEAMAPDAYRALFDLVARALAALKRALSPHGVNVGINLGTAAGAGIAEHLHVHLVPRWNGDTNFFPVMTDVRVMPEALDATWAHLAPFFADEGAARATSPGDAPALASRTAAPAKRPVRRRPAKSAQPAQPAQQTNPAQLLQATKPARPADRALPPKPAPPRRGGAR